MNAKTATPIVSLENTTKTYGGIAALAEASFELYPGEIHALVGENGAGKSTLCKLIAGVIAPTEGVLRVDGEAVSFSAPKDAGARGTVEVSMAKLHATEAAQDVIDRAVQLLGGRGVVAGAMVEHLYRAIRPLRIYEGTSEIQRTIIGRAIATGGSP